MAGKKGNLINLETARLLDANLNRAKEGLRVVEDTARFMWEDKLLFSELRKIRHQLHKITKERYSNLISSRDTRADAGRKMKESPRKDLKDVVVANMKRAQEATRVLEEFSKVFSHSAAHDLKRIRFQLYKNEKKIFKRNKW